MSETEKPAEVLLSTAANGAGPPENTGDGTVPEKIGGKENGIKTPAEETGLHEQKDGDVHMMDAADVKVGEQNEEGNGEEVVPMTVDGEEGETEEPKDGRGTKEESEVAMEKQKGSDERTEDAGKKNDGAEGKSEFSNDEKGKESEGKGEEIEENDEQTEVQGDGAEERSEEKTEEEEGPRKKGRRGRKVREKGQGKEKKQRGKTKEALRTPTTSSIDRPVRERKTVERLVEIVEKGPSKAFLIEKGRGTPLKDIPNVAYKLSKKKPADIRSLHLLLFGRKGKAINFKSHIFQFSGFVWHENEDKQKAKLKEKLDKCVKDKLLDLCDVFDIPDSRATSRKEDLMAKLLDFMVAPHATTDVILAEKEQSAKSRKRKRGSRRSALRRCVGISVKQSRKKRIKSENTSRSGKSTIETEDEDEYEEGDAGEEDKVNGLPDEDEAIEHSESEEEEESEHDNAEKESEYSAKGRQITKKLSKKQVSPATAKSKKVTTPKRTPQRTLTRSPKKPASKRFKADVAKDSNEVFSRKKKNIVTLKKKMPSSKSDMEEKKTTGKKAGRSKAKSEQAEKSSPTDEELRKTICEILKEVDFNTATFTDILKKLASHYKMDLTARKASIKLMIQDELTKLADEAEEDEDDDSEDEGDTEKVENSEPAGKEVEA